MLVWNRLLYLENLAHQNKGTLMWVPSHHAISSNEGADQLARAGWTCLFTGPEPFVGFLPLISYEVDDIILVMGQNHRSLD